MIVGVQDLLAKTKEWSIVGQDLVAQVTCQQPYEWKDPTGENWEYRMAISSNGSSEPLHVRPPPPPPPPPGGRWQGLAYRHCVSQNLLDIGFAGTAILRIDSWEGD